MAETKATYTYDRNMISVEEFAQLTLMSPRRVRQLIASGEIAAEKVNPRLYMIPRAELDKRRKTRERAPRTNFNITQGKKYLITELVPGEGWTQGVMWTVEEVTLQKLTLVDTATGRKMFIRR